MPVRHGSAEWQGTLKEGKGAIRVGRDKETRAYNYRTRFENEEGSNPEELIGAAHAGCFAMALAHLLSTAGHTPERINTTGKVALEEKDGVYSISSITLECEACVPGVTPEEFQSLAESAKRDCPVSRLLTGVEILLDVKLV